MMNTSIDNLILLLEKNEKIKDVFSISQNSKNNVKMFNYFNNLDGLNGKKLKQDITDLLSGFTVYPLPLFNEEIAECSLKIKPNNLKDCSFEKLAYLKILLLIYFSLSETTKDYTAEFRPIKIGEDNHILIDLYRGQSNYSFGLLPSIYRNLNYNGIITYSNIQAIYQNSSMWQKYYEIFGSLSIDYSFVSFMQHSMEYSPLLDFSTNKNIALIFASNSQGKNYNQYNETDCSLYTLSLSQNQKVDHLDFIDHNVQYYKSKLKFDSTIFNKPLVLCNINDFKVNYEICLTPTNDRMKYQKGAFLYFKKCVIANGHLFMPYTQGVVTKYKIYSETHIKNKSVGLISKQELYKKIVEQEPYYDLEHLLNPYLYFSEYNR